MRVVRRRHEVVGRRCSGNGGEEGIESGGGGKEWKISLVRERLRRVAEMGDTEVEGAEGGREGEREGLRRVAEMCDAEVEGEEEGRAYN